MFTATEMKTSLEDAGFSARDNALNFALRQWDLLHGNDRVARDTTLRTFIDPEALFLVSLALQHQERRFARELEWLTKKGGHLINFKRLKTLARLYPASVSARLGPYSYIEWQQRMNGSNETKKGGIIKNASASLQLNNRNMPDFTLPQSLMLQLRAGFGTSPETDILACLIGFNNQEVSIDELCTYTGYTHSVVQKKISFMILSRFIKSNSDPETPRFRAHSALNRMLNYYIRNAVEWSPQVKEHSFNVLVGNEIKATDRRNRGMDGYGISYDLGLLVKTDSKFMDKLTQDDEVYFFLEQTHDRYIGNFFSGAYAYKGKYLINGSFRYDGSNQLGDTSKARWLPSYNISAGWNASKENFLKNASVINHLKLKTTYGLTGILPPKATAQLKILSQIRARTEQEESEIGIKIYDLENAELTWEKLYEWNTGIELGLWNNRIFTEVNFYKRKSKDLIDYIETSGIGGIPLKYGNIGDLEAQGVEVTLKTKNIDFQNFKWNTQFTFNYYTDEITRLESHDRMADFLKASGGAMLGRSQRGIFSIPFAGLNSQGIPTFFDKEGNVVTNINLQNKDDIRQWLRYEGPTAPRYQGGLINRFKYKNWGLSVNIIYKAGNKIRLDNLFHIAAHRKQPDFTDAQAYPKEFLNRWIVPGDEQFTTVPSFPSKDVWHYNYSGDNAYALYNNSTHRVAKGDFIRLKDISLSYTFPKAWLKNVKIQNASISLSTNNIWLIYSDKKLNGIDPEFFNAGGVALPIQRTYTFSLNVNF